MLARSDVEAIDLCTVHSEHAPQALAALRAGRHVLVEKPFATSLADCRAVAEAADAAGRVAMIAQCQRYEPGNAGAADLIRSGALGAIRAVRFDCMQNLEFYVKPGHWLWDGARAGGGVVISVMVHRIDLMRFLVGEIVRVTAVTRHTHPAMVNGAEDFVCVILEFANGAVGEAFGTYVGCRLPYSESLMVFGEKGTVHAVPDKGQWGGPILVATADSPGDDGKPPTPFSGFRPVPERPGFASPIGFVNEILHFADCCRSGAQPLTSARDNIETMKVIFAIYESARTGRPVEVASL
jgi:predicted dehydrogenase